jgi:hypothetical protein
VGYFSLPEKFLEKEEAIRITHLIYQNLNMKVGLAG